MHTQLTTNPNRREELKKLGYADRQIPGWVITGEAQAVQAEPVKAAEAA
jgi:ribosomal protein L39E